MVKILAISSTSELIIWSIASVSYLTLTIEVENARSLAAMIDTSTAQLGRSAPTPRIRAQCHSSERVSNIEECSRLLDQSQTSKQTPIGRVDCHDLDMVHQVSFMPPPLELLTSSHEMSLKHLWCLDSQGRQWGGQDHWTRRQPARWTG